MTFSEVRNEADDFIQLGPISVDSVIPKKMASRRDNSNFDSSSSPATASSSSGVSPILGTGSNSSPEDQSEPGQKAGFNWWKRQRLSFSMTWRREPVCITFHKFSKPGSSFDLNRNRFILQREDEATAKISSKPSEPEPEKPATAEDSSIEANRWVVKDLVSRDRKSKLRSGVYTASIDQRSEQAGGETACAAVAVVVAHWFQANPRLINPSETEFDSLIMQGSALWKSLCNDESYLRLFPNRHFDLETVVSAKLRPVRVCNDKSFTGLFSPERFASLEGLMSFDQIWDEVEKEVAIASGESRVYIVSWNDHFFVVKADLDGFCVIDSLGERLFEGCKQAYILKFDDSSLMYEKKGEEESSAVVVCKGKECCREYIKRFLAAIPVAELAAKEEKGNVVDVSLLHEKLQIDLHHIMLTGD